VREHIYQENGFEQGISLLLLLLFLSQMLTTFVKTIMTIAILAHLACEKGIGAHLIIVSMSVTQLGARVQEEPCL
jgi:hypothetical protein